MRRNKLIWLMTFCLSLLTPVGTPAWQKPSYVYAENTHIENLNQRIVIELSPEADLDEIARRSEGEVIRRGPLNYATLVFAYPDESTFSNPSLLQQIRSLPGVLDAQWSQTYRIEGSSTPAPFSISASTEQRFSVQAISDPQFSSQWYLNKVRAPQAWAQGATGEGVVIAVVDTGVDLNFTELVDPVQNRSNLVPGYNAIYQSTTTRLTQDDNGHGTSVATLIAALNNGIGMVGVAYNAKIMPIKAMGRDGIGEDSVIADGIIWAADHGARIINLSIGSPDQTPVLEAALEYAAAKGCLLIGASGNNRPVVNPESGVTAPVSGPSTGVAFPAAHPQVLAVSAVDQNDRITDFSLVGPEVAISAPGERILAGYWTFSQEGLGYSTGTSIAAPFVSGAAALLWSKYPALTAQEIRQALVASAVDLGAQGRDASYGYGRLDIARALQTLQTSPSLASPANVTWGGGRVYLEDPLQPAAQLTIPAGAFPLQADASGNDLRLSVTLEAVPSPGEFPAGVLSAGEPIQLKWGEELPRKILTLTLALEAPATSDDLAYLYKWSGTRWLRIGGGIAALGEETPKLHVPLYEPGIYRAGWSLLPAENRIFGKDRIATSLEIAKAAYPTGADTVFLARADAFPDALAGAPLAYRYHAPILLTDSKQLPKEVRQRILELAPRRIFLLGGTGAISTQVESDLAALASVTRIAGADRYETAAAVARWLGTTGEAVLVSGTSFPDAIAAAAHAAQQGRPILLTGPGSLPEPSVAVLRTHLVTSSEVIGGPGVVAEEVFRTLPGPLRISGLNRYDTSAAILHTYEPQGKLLYVATGQNFPDALTGGILAATGSANIFLLSPSGPTTEQRNILAVLGNKHLIALGGEAAVPNRILAALRALTGE